jgi:uncharacterized protein YjbJ (UPF0337 family)
VANQMTTEDPGASGRAGQVAGAARDEAQSVAGDVRQEASAVASEARAQAQNLVEEARSALRTQARQGADRAAGALDDLGARLRSLASGDREGAGELGRYADQAGERLHRFADRLGSRGFDGLVDDIQSFARRRPGVFLAAAAASGFAAGRLFRGAQAASSGDGDRSQAQEGTAAIAPGESAAPVAGPEGGTTPGPTPYGGATSDVEPDPVRPPGVAP